jgi:signal peptidase I
MVKGEVYVTKTDGETIMLDNSFVTTGKDMTDFGPVVVPEDSYFMLGDNRINSWDARYWNNKFVHKDKILGKVKFRYLPKISTIE